MGLHNRMFPVETPERSSPWNFACNPVFQKRMSLRPFSLGLLLICSSLLGAAPSQPNIVFFLVDDLGYSDCGFNGGREIKTPHIDRLAKSGAVLEHHYVQPVCSPTRSALLTGRYPTHTGVYTVVRPGAHWGLPINERTCPGDERNTSPSVAIDVFAASECADMDQIHAAWSSTPVYGQRTSPEPVLGGLSTKDHSGRRGVWWTYQFYAKSTGDRLTCREGMSGGAHLVGLAFADASARRIRVLVGTRDGSPDQPGSLIQIDHIP